MIAANPVIGIGMLLRNVMSDSDRDEQKKKQAAEIWDEIKGARRWANEANAGVMRALEALRTKVERQYEELLNLIFRGLARSRVAPTVSWQDMCEIYLRETAREIRETCVKYPSLREEFSSLQLDPEVAALLP
jgi:hypothetical protein